MKKLKNFGIAAGALPVWATPLMLSLALSGLYFTARSVYTDVPPEIVSQATLGTILVSIGIAVWLAMRAVWNAEGDFVKASLVEALTQGFSFIWAASTLALFTYLFTAPVLRFVFAYTGTSTGLVLCLLLVGTAYRLSRPKAQVDLAPQATSFEQQIANPPALLNSFTPTAEQLPAFQLTMVDLTRLIIHQAGRLIGFHGSNFILNESFSADLDIQARTAKIFTDMNLIHTQEIIHWRMHMVLMGSAAERVILKSNSQAAMDDLLIFEDLATQYVALSDNRSTFIKPVSQQEAMVKSARLAMVKKHVLARCQQAVEMNLPLVLDLVKILRSKPHVSMSEIGHILDQVRLPDGFPIAEFESEEALEIALASIAQLPQTIRSIDEDDEMLLQINRELEQHPIATDEADNVVHFNPRATTFQA